MFYTGTRILDAAAWDKFLAVCNPTCRLVTPPVRNPNSFPFIVFACHSEKGPPEIFTVRQAELVRIMELPASETIPINDFQDGEIQGVVVSRGCDIVHGDSRGCLVEVAREDEDNHVRMVYVSTTRAHCLVRGPHEHFEQTDRFLFLGRCTVWLWDNRVTSPTYRTRTLIPVRGIAKDSMTRVVVPPGVVHAYRNDSEFADLIVVNAPDQLYKGWDRKHDVDEIRHEDDPESPFKPW